MPAIIQGASRSLRRAEFTAALKQAARKHHIRLRDFIDMQIEATIAELRVTTPRHTGAGAGNPTGIAMYKSHPGYGMDIGNERGDTGWQKYSNHPDHFSIINPMWEPYLKVVNYTHRTNANFLEAAVRNLRERIKYLKA